MTWASPAWPLASLPMALDHYSHILTSIQVQSMKLGTNSCYFPQRHKCPSPLIAPDSKKQGQLHSLLGLILAPYLC